MKPRYTFYIISKGRWESRLTSKAFEKMKLPYYIVIEPQEYDQYASVINPEKILKLPFSNLGLGSIPARNWVWDYSVSKGEKRHWIFDDNIRGFMRIYNNHRTYVFSTAIFRAAEDFVDRYENVALAGFQYHFFAIERKKPIELNTRIYSNILIKNDIPYRWRGRYNEDTDLSLRVLKDNWCTVLFNAFLARKAPTMQMKGGNTDELYKQTKKFDGRLEMAKSLQRQHPDCVTITRKWHRWQHLVDYSRFRKNKLILKKDIIIPKGVNEYGMVFKS